MNRLFFSAVYLTVFTLLPWTCLPGSSLPIDSLPLPPGTECPAPPEYAPLTNEPFFPGGPAALEAYLRAIDAYPIPARASGLAGTVRIRFRVLPDGRLTDVRIRQAHGSLLDTAALQIVRLMPRWYPAHQAGVAVACLVELSIVFCFE